ncbi:MAG: YihY family inner membrane protein, partial [Mariprofundaceae bacterium]
LVRLIARIGRRFVADKCIQRASALAYASLLAIVPLVALGFSVFSGFQFFEEAATRIRDALLEYLVPASRETIEAYLATIADRSAALPVFGVIGLLVTATALLNTVEEAFNAIWRITRARPWLSKFITFWAILTLAPLLIGASLTITSYFAALPVVKDVAAGAVRLGELPFLLPWLMSSLALAVMYVVLPNTSVPARHAFVGGMVAGALFELTKFGFAFYVTDVANYQRIYGALSTLPIFLIWLYLAWVVVLIGAETTFCLHHPEQSSRQRVAFLSPGVRQFHAHLVLALAALAHRKGAAVRLDTLCEQLEVPDNILQEWLDELTRKGLLQRVEGDDGCWVLAIDADHLTLEEIHQRLNPPAMTIPPRWRETEIGRVLAGLYFRLDRERQQTLAALTLTELADHMDGDPETAAGSGVEAA